MASTRLTLLPSAHPGLLLPSLAAWDKGSGQWLSLTLGTALHGLPPFVKYDFRVRCVLLLAHVFHVLASQEPPVEVKEEPEADVKKVLSETFYYDYPELVSIPYVSSEERIPLYFLTLKYPLQLYIYNAGGFCFLGQGSANYSPWSKCGLQPVCVNKVLLQHRHIPLHSVYSCLNSCD